ncbi:MAG TPA: matrixin family metalloprotease [Polyangiaceae bacterium]
MKGARLVGAGAALALLCSSAWAFAYCRTTTCDPRKEACGPAGGCPTRGVPLFWPSGCVSFSVQKHGSPAREIEYDAARDTIQDGFRAWINADCGGGAKPTIQVSNYNEANGVACAKQEYNQGKNAGNANIWMFLDNRWPYANSEETLALTTITFNVQNGEIYDADVELNSYDKLLTIGDANINSDLLSVVTHEAGHFLGLAHAESREATMYPSYNPGETKLRTLTADDVAGICDIYPANRPISSRSCEPRHGFSERCGGAADDDGCTTSAGPARPGGLAALSALSALAASAIALGFRSRRRRSSRD